MITLDFHPSGMAFAAKVNSHAVAVPFSTLSLDIGDCKVNIYAKADDALKLIRVAHLLNEVFAKEGEQVE